MIFSKYTVHLAALSIVIEFLNNALSVYNHINTLI